MRTRSRRLASIAVAALLAGAIVAVPASALFVLDYSGHVRHDPGSLVGFDLTRTHAGKRKVTSFTTGGIQFSCKDGSTGRTEFLTLDRSLRVKHRKFKGAVHVFTAAVDPLARVHGKLHRDHRVANGTIHLVGKLDSTDPKLRCDTGVLEWRATVAD
jgi:hypothetical protein